MKKGRPHKKKVPQYENFLDDYAAKQDSLEDLFCTCDDDPYFCEVHKERICTCKEDPDYCPVHCVWI